MKIFVLKHEEPCDRHHYSGQAPTQLAILAACHTRNPVDQTTLGCMREPACHAVVLDSPETAARQAHLGQIWPWPGTGNNHGGHRR
jgi:hypothetical protein